MTPDLAPLPWMADAECVNIGIPADEWYPELGDNVAHAKAICRGCPVLDLCRDYVDTIESGDYVPHGIWAAETPRQRRSRRSRARQAAA